MRSTTLLNPVQTPTLAAFVTGEAVAPLWVSPTGRAFYPIAGGAPDDDPPKKDDSPKDDPKKDDPPKFEAITSQEEFDRRLSARLSREREKYSDYDDLKAKAAAHDKALEDAKSDAEKAVDAARKEGETAAEARSNAKVVRAEAKTLAGKMNFIDPGDVVAFLDLSKVKVDDKGDADEEDLKGLLEKLAEDKPHLVDDGSTTKPRRTPKPDKSQGGGGEESGASSVSRGRDLRASRRPRKAS